MRLITPDCGWHIWHQGKRYRELPAKEVRELPKNTTVFVAATDPAGKIQSLEKYTLGYRFSRPVLFKMPFQDVFLNIGKYAGRRYLIIE